MQMISKGFLKKKAEPRKAINNSAHLPQWGRKHIYAQVSNFGIYARTTH